jgi:hypothetical protein
MDMMTALAGLGVTAGSIDGETRERLDLDGYAPLTGILSDHQLTMMRMRLAELLAAEGDQAGLEVHQEAGADRLADLINKDPVFDVCFTATCGMAAQRTAHPHLAAPCTLTSPGAATPSNSTRGSTSGGRHYRGSVPLRGSSLTSSSYARATSLAERPHERPGGCG